ncbi:hypothetical protein BpHYR1_005769, partial [Brachionus plicatilis]
SKLKNQKNKDSENDLTNLVNDDNRGLSTDMLGFPALSKTPTELILSSLPEIENISHTEEIIEKEFVKVLHSRCFDNQMIVESLSKILDICKNEDLVNKIAVIESLIQELKKHVSETKDAKFRYLHDLIDQKDAKIKLLDSRIKLLQKYCNLKEVAKI